MDAWETLRAIPVIFQTVAFLLGLIVGSFLNVAILRLPVMLKRQWRALAADELGLPFSVDDGHPPVYNLIWPRSSCPACGAQILARDNIPVLGWLLLRGGCRSCRASIDCRYPLIELLTGAVTAWIAAQQGFTPDTVLLWGLAWSLIVLAFIDCDEWILPDVLTIPLIWAGLLVNLHGRFVSSGDAVLGAASGYGVLWVITLVYGWIRKRQGMGNGDFKLLAAIGAWGGWQVLLPTILLASLLFVLFAALVTVRRGERVESLPFGPWIALGGFLSLLYGQAWWGMWIALFVS